MKPSDILSGELDGLNAITALEKVYACPSPRRHCELKPFRNAFRKLREELLVKFPRLRREPDPVYSWIGGIEGEWLPASRKEQAALLSSIGL